MNRAIGTMAVVLLLVAGAIFVRYGSFQPCDWLLGEMAIQTGMSPVLFDAWISAQTAVPGSVFDFMTPTACAQGWLQTVTGNGPF